MLFSSAIKNKDTAEIQKELKALFGTVIKDHVQVLIDINQLNGELAGVIGADTFCRVLLGTHSRFKTNPLYGKYQQQIGRAHV